MRLFAGQWAAGLGLLACAMTVGATDSGGGHFRKGGHDLALHHAIAVAVEALDPADNKIYVFLSDIPLDAAKIAASFHPEMEASMQMEDRDAGYVRICIDAAGKSCDLSYSRNITHDTFNTSGGGDFSCRRDPKGRISGQWVMTEPKQFFGEPYDYDLKFDVAITHAPGDVLPADGGAPGAAYRDWAKAVATGDFSRLRQLAGDGFWQMQSEDPADAKSALQDLRNGTPLAPEIVRGGIAGDAAVLWVKGRDRDDLMNGGRVLLLHKGGQWRVDAAELEKLED